MSNFLALGTRQSRIFFRLNKRIHPHTRIFLLYWISRDMQEKTMHQISQLLYKYDGDIDMSVTAPNQGAHPNLVNGYRNCFRNADIFLRFSGPDFQIIEQLSQNLSCSERATVYNHALLGWCNKTHLGRSCLILLARIGIVD